MEVDEDMDIDKKEDKPERSEIPVFYQQGCDFDHLNFALLVTILKNFCGSVLA